MLPKPRIATTLAVAGAAALLAASPAAAQLASPVSARDSAETSLAPTGLVFTAQGSQLTIAYDGQTLASLVDHIRGRGLIGLVSCNQTVDGAPAVAGSAVVWQRSHPSVTVPLVSRPGQVRLISCRLTEAGDSSDPVEVFFDQAALAAQTDKIAGLRAIDDNEAVGLNAQKLLRSGSVARRGGFAKRLAKALHRRDRGTTYKVARLRDGVRRMGVVYVLRSSTSRKAVLARKLSDGRIVLTTVTRTGIASMVVRARG